MVMRKRGSLKEKLKYANKKRLTVHSADAGGH